LIAGAVHEQAMERLAQIKKLILNKELFNLCFPDLFSLSNLANEKALSVNRDAAGDEKEASIVTSGLGGEKTGSHVNLSILDDLVSDLTSTKVGTEEVVSYFKKMMPLLDGSSEKGSGKIFVVGTPWAEDDGYRWLVNTLEDAKIEYKYFTETAYTPVDMILTQYKDFDAFTSAGGALNYPTILPFSKLKLNAPLMGSTLFFSQYQMTVLPGEDGLFTMSQVKWVDRGSVPKEGRVYILCDPAGDPTEDNAPAKRDSDFVAIVVVRLTSDAIYLIDGISERLTHTQAIEFMLAWFRLYKATLIGVEKTGLGTLGNQMRVEMRRLGMFAPVQDMKPKQKSKFSRVSDLSPFVELGMLRLVKGEPVCDVLYHQMSMVRRRMVSKSSIGPKYDDVVDALAWITELMVSYGVPDDAGTSEAMKIRESLGEDVRSSDYWVGAQRQLSMMGNKSSGGDENCF
jgi:hypothetical protein